MMVNIDRIPFVDLYAQYLSIKPEIDEVISTVITESGFIRSRYVDNFEEAFSKTLGVRYCVSCGNGTDALYIAMKGLKIKSGDEVITTAHSWISTSEAITQAGGKVVFCDTDRQTFTIDPKQIPEKITSRTVGIIPVHLYGQPADIDPILEIAKKNGLWVLEDCAQAHLSTYRGRLVGTFGQMAIFSFYPGKNLGAMGDAGCLVTNDAQLAEWCALYARHGGKGKHVMEGINSRMDGLQAAILLVKLPYLPNWTARRQELARLYEQRLAEYPSIQIPKVGDDRTHVYHLYVIKTLERDALRAYLARHNIESNINYPKILPLYPAYAYLGYRPEEFPQAWANQNKILSLPIYPEMTLEQVNRVADVICEWCCE